MNFSEVIGNNDIKNYLLDSINKKNILHSYLFLGTEGIGKSLVAKAFAKKILCLEDGNDDCTCKSCTMFDSSNNDGLIVLEKQSDKSIIPVDDIRKLIEQVSIKPVISSKRIFIINDFESASVQAQNCLLKTLEEPPEYVVMILIANDETKLLDTIKSRCTTLRFKGIEDKELLNYAVNELGYKDISRNFLKSFDGSIKKAIEQKNNKELYDKIETLVSDFSEKSIVDILKEGKVLNNKEKIYDILEYMIVSMFSNMSNNEKYLDAIKYVTECSTRLKANSNFEICLDNMLLKIWEEINEESNRR